MTSRRHFLHTAACGGLSLAAWQTALSRLASAPPPELVAATPRPRIAKVYLGHPHPGWPSHTVDLEADMRRYEAEFARRAAAFGDVELVDCGLVNSPESQARAVEQIQGADGVLALHLTLGTGPQINALLETGRPVVLYTQPYAGHEWHIVASLQRQGKAIVALPSSDFDDLLTAVRPLRALRRLKDTRVLHVSQDDADAAYVAAVARKFGVRVISIHLDDLQRVYQDANEEAARADAERWILEAEKVVEPTREEILKGSRMFVAMQDLLRTHRATAITMNCLGMGLIDRGMGYPCLGFARLNDVGLGGVCEADLKSTLTHLVLLYLVGLPGFVTDPMFDLSKSAIIHAHCVSATRMKGPRGAAAPYVIRSHLEDGKGAALQVRLPVGDRVTMARLIGTDLLLCSTGQAVDSPFEERGCRTKLTVRVEQPERFLENWSCGLHRVVFYGDHTADLRRFCHLAGVRLVEEGREDLQDVPGLEWEPHVHA